MSDVSAVEALLFAALEKETAAERVAFLDSACAGDAELRRQVEKLLKAHADVGDFLQKPVAEQVAAAPEPAGDTHAFDAATDDPDAGPVGGTSLSLARTEGGGAIDPENPFAFLQPATRPDSLGRLGRYEVLEVLGQGGFGIVFRAFDDRLQRVVAIKVLAPAMAGTALACQRFLREARSSARVRHVNVVQIYAVEEEPLPHLVMEFVPGETLQQLLGRTGSMKLNEVVGVGRQIAEGLAAAHAAGLIHRDIKPGNILIEPGPKQHVKITDFGLARAAGDASLTQSGVLAGTPMFMSPEQANADKLDHRADLFSLGSVLYLMCSGQPPFRASNTLAVLKRVIQDTPRPIHEIIPEAPSWLCDVIARLHAKKPDDRIATAREVADLLGNGLAALQASGIKPATAAGPVRVHKTPPAWHPPEASRTIELGAPRRRWPVAAIVSLTLLGGLALTEATGVSDVRGTALRLFSPKGTLEVPDSKVVSRKPDAGTKSDTKSDRGSQAVPPGAKDDKTGAGARALDPDRRAAEYVLSCGGSVKIDGQETEIRAAAALPQEAFRLTMVQLARNQKVTDAGLAIFIDCNDLTRLSLWQTNVGDEGLVHVKKCKAVSQLWLGTTKVTDAGLAHLADRTNLIFVDLMRTKVTDVGLAYLKGCRRLDRLDLRFTGTTDAGLAHFADCKRLTALWLNNTQVTDAGLAHVAGLNQLTQLNLANTKVTAKGVAGLAKALPTCRIEWHGGVLEPAAAAQVEEIRAELMRRNPDFRGKLIPKFKDGVVTGLRSQGVNLNRSIADLSSLRGMKLTQLIVTNHSGVSDLTPLRGMPLEHLSVWSFLGSDLTPLQGMPLKILNIGGGRQKLDLTPLAGLPLDYLCVNISQVSDLTPLKDMPLTDLEFSQTLVTDLTPLRGLRLQRLGTQMCKVSDLTPLTGMPLKSLYIFDTDVTDLTPLQGMPLQEIWLTPKNITRGLDILREMKSLKTIGVAYPGGWSPAEFWARYDRGELK